MNTPHRANGNAAKYVQIREELAALIRNRTFRPGQRVPSEGDMMKRYGCSRPTVVRAIQDLVGRGVLVREHGRGTFVAPHADLAPDAKRAVVLISPFLISSGSYAAMADGVSRVAQERGYRFQIQATGNDAGRFGLAIEEAVRHPESLGVLMVPLFDAENMPLNEQAAQRLIRAGVPAVLVNHKVVGVASQLPFVGSEDHPAACDLAAHLIEQGHRRIAFLRATSSVSTDQARYEGYLKALGDAGLESDRRYVMHVASHDPYEQGCAEVEKLMALPEPPTAVMCGYDLMAANVMRWLLDHGYALPRDVAVTGFSDDLGMLTTPTLTTATQPMDKVGMEACRILLDLIEGKPAPEGDVVFPSVPVYRQSTCRSDAMFQYTGADPDSMGRAPVASR